MQTLIQDLRYGARVLLKKPGFTAIAVITLALGIGANTAIFSVVSAVLLRPLPFKDPNRLVWVSKTDKLSPADFLDYRSQNRVFEGIAGFIGWGVNLTGDGEPERLRGSLVSPEFFSVLGIPAHRGRTFLSTQNQSAPVREVVLSYGLWQRRFGSDPRIVERTLTLNGESCLVVGVMPRDFRHPGEQVEIWVLARRVVPELPFRTGGDLWQNRGLH
ncbi:MAG: ABC transporter permease [Acidobacteria bacterium]|nr:ABC transporter permease [Acidobacteriota bacterium]